MTTLAAWKVLEPDSYYRSFIEKNSRPDGRPWESARPITLNVGSVTTAEGSATVRFGNTSVVCGVKAEIAVPELREPEKGFLVPNIELHPCCSPSVKAGPPGEMAINATHVLANVVKSSEMIDLKSLCIVPNKFSWCLYVDIACLDYDGNLIDAALLALVAALENTRLPKTTYDEETERLSVADEKAECLKILARPLSTTFSCYGSEARLLDPTAEDEKEGDNVISVVLKSDSSICLVHKSGGMAMVTEDVEKFIDVAKDRRKELVKRLDKANKTAT